MVRFRDAVAVLAVLMMLFTAVPVLVQEDSSSASAKTVDGLLLYELEPKDVDGVAVMNYGSSPVNLKDYSFKNSSGKTYSLKDQTLSPGNVAVFVKKTVEDEYGFFTVPTSTRTVRADSSMIALKDGGDAVYLLDPSGNNIDTVCYGNYQIGDVNWSGIPVDLGYQNYVIRRVEPTDTNTYFDWASVGRHYTAFSFADTKTVVTSVTPFTFPECGGVPILSALKTATESVKISIYMLTSGYVVSVLADRMDNEGIDVKIILENKPLGYDNDGDLLKPLVDRGAEIKFIGGGDCDRYSYAHNKYAIVDGSKVIITSENWTAGNISKDGGNRGWGAIVDGAEFATEMSKFFDNDWNFNADFKSFADRCPEASAKSIPSIGTVNGYISSVGFTPTVFSGVSASIYMSPDNTFKAMQYLIDNAEKRVYTEQMDIGASYTTFATTSPLSSMIKAADRGVDARFMITKDKNEETIDKLNTTTNVKSAGMGTSGYATMHNKGVIIDDTVWVSSVNWTENAFLNNRECGLYLRSAELTDYYLDAYMYDWNKNYKLTDILTVVPDIAEKKFSVQGGTGSYQWKAYDKDGNVVSSCSGPVMTLESLENVTHISVASDSGSTGRYILSGSVDPTPEPAPSDDQSKLTTYGGIAVGVLVVLGIILKFLAGAKKR